MTIRQLCEVGGAQRGYALESLRPSHLPGAWTAVYRGANNQLTCLEVDSIWLGRGPTAMAMTLFT